MKKTFKIMAVCLGAALSAAAFAACKVQDKPQGFSFAGDLQALYGGDEGYPQAVLVGKKSVIEEDEGAIGTLLSYFEGSKTYLENTDGATIANLLQSKYPSDQTPTFNANNLTKEVISNCSVRFTKSADCKAKVNEFLGKLIGVNAQFTTTVSDAFYYTGTPAAAASSHTYTVYAPDGAPALSLAYGISKSQSTFEYHIDAAAKITSRVTGESPAADFCVLPVNAASKLLGTGEKYKMLGTVTNGNMYLISAGGEKITSANLKTALKGKTIGVIQLNNVPGLVLRMVLEANDVEYKVLDNDASPDAEKVNLKALADAVAVTPAGGCDYYLCPEPAASSKVRATNS